jgi:hypothetical protein
MSNQWDIKLDYILLQAKSIHKWYSRELEWCFLTDVNGNRYRIDPTMTMEHIGGIIEKIKLTNTRGSGMRDVWNKIISN